MFNVLSRHFSSLVVLRTAVEAGSLNRAAKELGLTQPAITRSLARLEESVGSKLIDRNHRGVIATDAAKAILDHVGAAAFQLEAASSKLKAIQRLESDSIACGAAPVSMNSFVAQAVHNFHQAYPSRDLRLVEGTTPTMLEMMLAGELDVVVGSRIEEGKDLGFVVEPLLDETLGVYARADGRLNQAGPARMEELFLRQNWVFPDQGTHLHDFVEAELGQRRAAPPQKMILTRSTSALRWYVENTDYLAISTSLIHLRELAAGTVVRVETDWEFPTTKHVLYRRSRRQMSRAAISFIRAIKDEARRSRGDS